MYSGSMLQVDDAGWCVFSDCWSGRGQRLRWTNFHQTIILFQGYTWSFSLSTFISHFIMPCVCSAKVIRLKVQSVSVTHLFIRKIAVVYWVLTKCSVFNLSFLIWEMGKWSQWAPARTEWMKNYNALRTVPGVLEGLWSCLLLLFAVIYTYTCQNDF